MIQISEAYQQGHNAWDVHVESGFTFSPANPYKIGTEENREWWKGWNQNFNGIENE